MLYQLDPSNPSGISRKVEKGFTPYFAGGVGKPSLLDSVNGKHGAVRITAGTNVTIDNSGKDIISISATGGGSGSSPLTTKGDLWGFSTVDARLPVGADNQVLVVDSAQTLGVKWSTLTDQIGIVRIVTVTSGNYSAGSAVSTDYVYLIAGAHTTTMPTATGNSNRYTFKNNHTVAVTINRAGSDTIEGATSLTLGPNESVDLISNNTSAWSVI
jgi:hypothetical protein